MKKAIILFFLNMLVIQVMVGQFSINLEGGSNVANIKFKEIDFDQKAAIPYYYLGVTPQYNLNPKTSILLKTAFSAKGYQLKEGGSAVNIKYRFTYLDLVPEVNFSLQKNLLIGIGGYYSLKINEAANFDNMQWNKGVKSFHLTTPTDFGITSSIRVNFASIYLKVAYQYGLKNISDTTFTDQNGSPIGVEQFNRTLQIGVGYQFNFKKK